MNERRSGAVRSAATLARAHMHNTSHTRHIYTQGTTPCPRTSCSAVRGRAWSYSPRPSRALYGMPVKVSEVVDGVARLQHPVDLPTALVEM